MLGIFFLAFVALLVGTTRLMISHGIRRLSWAFAATYLALAAATLLIAWAGRENPLGGIVVVIPMMLSLPSSLLIFVLPRGSDALFALQLAAYGSLQYFIIGWVIERIIKRRQERRQPEA
jgi:hypothetical protein